MLNLRGQIICLLQAVSGSSTAGCGSSAVSCCLTWSSEAGLQSLAQLEPAWDLSLAAQVFNDQCSYQVLVGITLPLTLDGLKPES